MRMAYCPPSAPHHRLLPGAVAEPSGQIARRNWRTHRGAHRKSQAQPPPAFRAETAVIWARDGTGPVFDRPGRLAVHHAHATRRGQDRLGQELVYLGAGVTGGGWALPQDLIVRTKQTQFRGAGARVDNEDGPRHRRTLDRDPGGLSALGGAALECVNEVVISTKFERKETES